MWLYQFKQSHLGDLNYFLVVFFLLGSKAVITFPVAHTFSEVI